MRDGIADEMRFADHLAEVVDGCGVTEQAAEGEIGEEVASRRAAVFDRLKARPARCPVYTRPLATSPRAIARDYGTGLPVQEQREVPHR